MGPTSNNKKINPLQQTAIDSVEKDKASGEETWSGASGISIGHRTVSSVPPPFSQMKKSEIASLPLKVKYTFYKSGKSIPLCRPRVNNQHYESVTFEVKHYSLDCLSDTEKGELEKIRVDIIGWVDFLTQFNLPFANQYSLSQFSSECSKHIEASISSDSRRSDSWKKKHLFVVLINDPENIFNINKVVSGISYCKDYGYRDLYIYQSFVNPKFQVETDDSLIIRGSGRALKQGVINFVESSDHYRSASSMPINTVSAYLNYTLGFQPDVKSDDEGLD